MTFYGLTHPLDKSWHVLGLGYSPSVDRAEIDNAAVVHYNGNMKPWLELAMTKYRPLWTKYIKFDHPYLRKCNLSEWTDGRVCWAASDFHSISVQLWLVVNTVWCSLWGEILACFPPYTQRYHIVFFICAIQICSLLSSAPSWYSSQSFSATLMCKH